MAKYTMELRKVIDFYGKDEVMSWFTSYNLSDYLTAKQIEDIQNYVGWTKEKLAEKILNHYYMCEIGFETPALFAHYAKVTMNEIMEEYLPLIYSASIEYDPFESVDFHIEETRNENGNLSGTNSGNSNSNSSSSGSGLAVNSDTPQGQINKEDILNGSYASTTGANETTSSVEDTTTTKSSINQNTTNNAIFKHHEWGNKGVMDSYQRLILELRNTFRAFDREIIEKLNNLFMGLF